MGGAALGDAPFFFAFSGFCFSVCFFSGCGWRGAGEDSLFFFSLWLLFSISSLFGTDNVGSVALKKTPFFFFGFGFPFHFFSEQIMWIAEC